MTGKEVSRHVKLCLTSIKLGLFVLKLLVKSHSEIGGRYNSIVSNGQVIAKMNKGCVSNKAMLQAKNSIANMYSILVDDDVPFTLIEKGCENRNLDSSILGYALSLLDGVDDVDNHTLANSLAGVESFIIESYEYMMGIATHFNTHDNVKLSNRIKRAASKASYAIHVITAINNALINQGAKQ